VALSGTTRGGTQGLDAIKAAGSITFARDATALHQGMLHSAIASGCVDFALPPDKIAREIVRISHYPHAAPPPECPEQDREPNFVRGVHLLYHATGVDFTHYKLNSLYRRVTRRMVLHKMDRLPEKVRFLRA
jgi:two-component system CheB/CheR fusion protein